MTNSEHYGFPKRSGKWIGASHSGPPPPAPRDLEDTVVSPGREAEAVDRVPQQLLDLCGQDAVTAEIARGHVGVRVDSGPSRKRRRWTTRARSTRSRMAALGSSAVPKMTDPAIRWETERLAVSTVYRETRIEGDCPRSECLAARREV